MLYLMELAIRKGRAARDGGEECLYDTPTARSLQAKKRQWTREYELRKAIEEAERERAEKEQAAAAAAAAARS
ncbi:hypothetical protein PTSG_13148 [Salpingoeca rosetta]|uniref:Uncharacterized protein n=1 Tax=Salpingoeca rosetta (strain ATCC 50818 / BSB-021) TaxID=946362 RepID=F2USM9_SALR5|nr:uncharacterized protein PTSG_13148 [Salpingoeca rosetta]EGD81138.1 hypothetical protein PTSG_13148 [Salpingoeca rosetta]|eukprot:XP_004987823.1 hypothetical protein PTSG_13148 [Salpingoeca rosetta]